MSATCLTEKNSQFSTQTRVNYGDIEDKRLWGSVRGWNEGPANLGESSVGPLWHHKVVISRIVFKPSGTGKTTDGPLSSEQPSSPIGCQETLHIVWQHCQSEFSIMGDLQISTWERRLISSANKPETLQDMMMIVMGGSQRPLIERGSHREEVAGEGSGGERAEQSRSIFSSESGSSLWSTAGPHLHPPPALRLSPPCLLRYVSIGRLSERESNLPASERQTPRE